MPANTNPGDDWVRLEPGMALTIEPGLYIRAGAEVPECLHGIGIRIEDDAFVSAEGVRGFIPRRRKRLPRLKRSCVMTEPVPADIDVLVVGAGPVGMTLALALANSPLRILLIDRRERGAWVDDPRALAIAHGSRQLLERLKAWNETAGTAIHEIHVSQRGGFGRTLLRAQDYGAPALGYVMRYRDLAARTGQPSQARTTACPMLCRPHRNHP